MFLSLFWYLFNLCLMKLCQKCIDTKHIFFFLEFCLNFVIYNTSVLCFFLGKLKIFVFETQNHLFLNWFLKMKIKQNFLLLLILFLFIYLLFCVLCKICFLYFLNISFKDFLNFLFFFFIFICKTFKGSFVYWFPFEGNFILYFSSFHFSIKYENWKTENNFVILFAFFEFWLSVYLWLQFL